MRAAALLVVLASVAILMSPYFYLAPLPALGLLCFFVLYWKPSIGFYLIIFLIPFVAFRKVGPVKLDWLVSIVLLSIFVFRIVADKKLPDAAKSNLWPLIALYLVASLVSTLFADFPDTARSDMLKLVAGYVLVFIGMASLSFASFRYHIPNMVIWSVGLSCILAVMDELFGLKLFSEEHLSGELTRSIGGSGDPNNFSVMILFTLPLVVHRIFFPTNKIERPLMLLFIPIMLIAIVSAFSRSGFLALLLCTFLLLHHYRHHIRPRTMGFFLFAALVGGIFTGTTVPSTFWERQFSLLSWEDGSLNRRASYLTVGKEAFLEHPIIGSGPGTFLDVYGASEVSLAHSRREADRKRRAHNTYLEILVGTGLIGFTLFMALNLRAFMNFRRAETVYESRGDPEMANLVASQRIGFVTLMLFLLTYSELYHKHMLLSLVLSQGAIYFTFAKEAVDNDRIKSDPVVGDTS